jgi:carbamoylphosphate synthase small subunit
MSSVILPEQSDIFGARALNGRPTGCIALADGSLFFGQGFGATGTAVGELCFNTAMTGYQEIMTDPSYAGQMVTFTFPHIGNVGANPEDDARPSICRHGWRGAGGSVCRGSTRGG